MIKSAKTTVVIFLSVLWGLLIAGCNTAPKQETRKILYIASTTDAPEGKLVGEVGRSRPEELKPGTIPKRVRYKAVDDAAVVRCATLLRDSLSTGKDQIFGDFLMLFPGAWSDMKRIPGLSLETTKHASFPREGGHTDEGRIFSPNTQGHLFLAHITRVVEQHYRIRAFTSEELAKWWIYIPFDIEEPIFILESEDSTRRYVVSFDSKDKVTLMDELSVYH